MFIQAGWANNDGTELFNIGWVHQDTFGQVTCLPIIGLDWLTGCPVQHYTWSWICCEPGPAPKPISGGGGKGKGKGKGGRDLEGVMDGALLPGMEPNIRQALKEDEELLVLLQSYLMARRKH